MQMMDGLEVSLEQFENRNKARFAFLFFLVEHIYLFNFDQPTK